MSRNACCWCCCCCLSFTRILATSPPTDRSLFVQNATPSQLIKFPLKDSRLKTFLAYLIYTVFFFLFIFFVLVVDFIFLPASHTPYAVLTVEWKQANSTSSSRFDWCQQLHIHKSVMLVSQTKKSCPMLASLLGFLTLAI